MGALRGILEDVHGYCRSKEFLTLSSHGYK